MFWNKRKNFLFNYSAKILMVTLAVAILLRALFISAYVIQTNAMSPTIDPGEFFIAWKNFVPKRGDVVVLPCVHNESSICIKRVVGLAGDRIEFTKQRLVINAISADYEKRVSDDDQTLLSEKWQNLAWPIAIDANTPDTLAPVMVPPNQVFLLNDHRGDDGDSRKWGSVPIEQLQAKAWRIWLSVNWSKNRINWGRLLKRID